MDTPLLHVENLSVIQNGHQILDSVSFDIDKGDTAAIIGPNGAGKTTLFRAALGLIPFTGTIKWKKGIKIGYVPQRLYIERDLPLRTIDLFSIKETRKDKIKEALETVGIVNNEHITDVQKHILENQLGNLSGGELQRVLIAWALLGSPDVLLFDEPTAGVDVVGEETIYTLLHKLKEHHGITILLISHELDVVFRYATKVICINKEKVCYGPPKLVLDKETLDKLFGEDIHFYKHEHKH